MWAATEIRRRSNAMTHKQWNSRTAQLRDSLPRGFSMIEMMVVLAVITIIMGVVFKSIAATQQTSTSQQIKVDLTQQARQFVDQLTRDLRSAGYPNTRNMAQGSTDPLYAGACPDATTNTVTSPCDPSNGVGLIYLNFNQLWFAGDVDGTGTTDAAGNPLGTANVKIVKYDYFPAGPNCPCLRRSEYLRTAYQDPVADATNTVAIDQMEIQGVQNGTANDPIFTAYDPTTGAAVPWPIDFTNGANQMAAINSLRVVLALQATSRDNTGAIPITRVVSTIALSNCSQAWGGTRKTFSC
jgi:prepilin-type N-terminal cleavage/methylation domain-containing protein